MYFKLALLMALPFTVAAEESGWRTVMHDEHEAAIDQAETRARSAMDLLGSDAYGLSDLPVVKALLQTKTMPRDYQALVGRWRCRSMQIDPLGVFIYPAFRCEIELTEEGTLVFTKTSGSQRRQGQIYAYTDRSWVFMGGQSINDEPYRSYSGTQAGTDAEEMQEYDSVGLLETLVDGRLRMTLDADSEHVELYELSR